MFPSYGKAYIEAICQYFKLQNADDSTIQSELEHVINLILGNQLPRELQYMNPSAKTVRELYVMV